MEVKICTGLRLLQLHAGFKPAHKVEKIHPRILKIRLTHFDLRVKYKRNPKIGRAAHAHAEKLGRRDADDREGRLVQHYLFVDDLWIAFPLLLPIAVTDHRGRLRRRFVIGDRKHATKECVDTQNVEVVT